MSMFRVQRQLVDAVIAHVAADRFVRELIGDDPRPHRLFCMSAKTDSHVFPAGVVGLSHRFSLTFTLPGDHSPAFVTAAAERIAQLVDDADIPTDGGAVVECSLERAAIEEAPPLMSSIRVTFLALTVAD